jgi:hypothetical protein
MSQLVSVAKSSVLFSSNTHVDVIVEVCNRLDIQIDGISKKYLRLPRWLGWT